MSNDPISRIVEFLHGVGLQTVARPGATGFIEGIEIVEGVLHYDPGAQPSNLLHEAGHLAVLPSRYRAMAGTDLTPTFECIGEGFNEVEVDSPEFRAMIQSGECEATAWSYAAGVAIGLEPDDIIHPTDFDNEGESVRFQLSMGQHFGVHGLFHGGMIENTRAYPAMKQWVQN